jgi:hypothetical protein
MTGARQLRTWFATKREQIGRFVSRFFVPSGRFENSPAIYRWECP